MKKLVSLLAVVSMLVVAVATHAEAASPSSGSIGFSRRTLKWKGGPYNVSYPVTSVAWCLQGASDSNCDHYHFKVNMGTGAKIRVAIVGSKSGLEAIQQASSDGVAPNDLDLAVYDYQGKPVGMDGNNTANEHVDFTMKSRWRNKPFEVRVIPFLVVPGTTYNGTIKTLKYVK